MIVYVVLGIFQILGLVSAVHAVMSTRTPQGAIAWTVTLVTFPYVAVPAYWVFGRNKFQGYVRARQEDIVEISDVARRAVERARSLAAPMSYSTMYEWKVATINRSAG